jgi:hypothetical protein
VEPASIWFAIFEALTGSAEIIGNGGDRQLDHQGASLGEAVCASGWT